MRNTALILMILCISPSLWAESPTLSSENAQVAAVIKALSKPQLLSETEALVDCDCAPSQKSAIRAQLLELSSVMAGQREEKDTIDMIKDKIKPQFKIKGLKVKLDPTKPKKLIQFSASFN